MTPEFLLTTLIVVATPGAGVLYTLAAGVSRGWQASLVAAFACTLGIVPHMIAAVTGLAAIMHASAVACSIIKWLGVAYLLDLAWKTFRDNRCSRSTANRSSVALAGHHVGHPGQHPEPEADDLLLRVPAPVRPQTARAPCR